MPDTPSSPAQRIDRALDRIDAAIAGRAGETESLRRRHQALRQRIGEAVAALDGLLAREGAD